MIEHITNDIKRLITSSCLNDTSNGFLLTLLLLLFKEVFAGFFLIPITNIFRTVLNPKTKKENKTNDVTYPPTLEKESEKMIF